MRIALVNPYLPPPVGGIEREVLNLSRCLSRMGHDPVIISTTARFPQGRHREGEHESFLEGAKTIVLPGYVRSTFRGFQPSRAPLVIPGLQEALNRTEPEAAIFFNIGWPLSAMRAVRRLSETAPVLLRTYYHPPGGRLRRYKNNLLFAFIEAFHAGVCATEEEKQQLLGLGFARPEKLEVIHPGARMFDFSPEEIERYREQMKLKGRLVISHVCRLSRFKGTGRLIDVLGQVRERACSPLTLLLIGKSEDDHWLETQIREKTRSAEVVRTGEIMDERELRLAVAASDVFALPSDYESFGLVFAEAMSVGVPVVAPATGGVPDLVEDGTSGFILDDPADLNRLRDKLSVLIEDPGLRRRMGEAGKAAVREKYTWEAATRGYLELITRIERDFAGASRSGN